MGAARFSNAEVEKLFEDFTKTEAKPGDIRHGAKTGCLKVFGLLSQCQALLQQLFDIHLLEENESSRRPDNRIGVLVEPLVTEARLDDAVLLHLHLSAHLAERTLNFVRRELGVFLALEALQEHVICGGDRVQRNWNDGGHLAWMKLEPHVAVTPNGDILPALWSVTILLDGTGNRLQHFVVRVRSTTLRVEGHGDDVWRHPIHEIKDGLHISIVRRLRGEDVGGIES